MLTLRLLGSPSFWVDGAPLTGLRYPQGRKLLAYLALQQGQPVERLYLAGLFWPETDEAQALFYLRRVLSDLRKALGSESWRLLSPTARTLALELTQAECDALGGSIDTELLLQGWTDDWVLAARQAWQSAKPTLHTAPRFLGRQELLRETLGALELATVVTLTGPGGVGKTRLARAVVQARGNGWGWVALASLSPESTLEELLARVAISLEVPAEGLTVARLAAQLQGRYRLIVLDNAEQVVSACAALIAALPQLRFLVTSRIPLECPQEQVITVPPLALPAAVVLFREHAARQGATHVEEETVAAICRSIDCLPLALELAAARLNLITPSQLQERLSTPLRLLRRSAGSLSEPRQATLEATIAWSYSLLSESERMAFLRLGAFQGEWSLEAAEAVLETPDASLLLESLVRQSLLPICRREETGEPRFDFLETIRAFIQTRPLEPCHAHAARAHAHYFFALAQRMQPEQRLGITALERIRSELAQALRWFQAHEPLTGVTLMLFLGNFWIRLSNGFPSRLHLTVLLEAAGESLPLPQKLQASRLLAALTPDYTQAHSLLTEAHRLAQYHALEHERGHCLLSLCLLEKQRDSEAVQRYAHEARVCFQRLGELEGEVHALEFQAIAALCRGKYPEAERSYTQFLVLARQLESSISMGDALYGLAQSLFYQERYAQAESVSLEALTQMPDEMGRANILYLLGELARHTGQPAAALPHYTEALRLCQQNLIHVLPAFIERSQAIVLAQQQDFPAAWGSIQRALVEFRRYKIGAQLGATLTEMAWIAHQEGKPQEAQVFLEQARQSPPRDARHPRDEARLRLLWD